MKILEVEKMEIEALLQNVMRKHIEDNLVAGVSILVEKDGKEICFLAEGMADVEQQKPIKRDTIFRLYSQTKPVTAAAAMILVERGLLDLGQPVSDYLPTFRNQTVWQNGGRKVADRKILVQDLLQMTSGMCYPEESTESGRQSGKVFRELEERLYGDHPMTTLEVANALGQCVLDFEPGTSWKYGTSADILGAVIEVAAQMPFGEFLKKEIFEPLGMKDTAFWVPAEKQDRLAKTYETVEGETGKILVRYDGNHLGIQNRMEREPAFVSGGAGLACTLDDYMRFAKMLLQEGELDGVRILKKETVKYLVGGQLWEHQQKVFENLFGKMGYSYGNLMRVCKNPSQAALLARKGEYGWDGWLGPYFENYPGENMTILIGMQKKDAGTWSLT
ncbi:MAG: serine hydrolase domain-containing protein, partial [Candidatus Limivivens sp.]|nr:serine hydrolase domain-containing protein [Candidatus Limivivens sp.]